MGILIDRSTRVLVQGITGREGSLRARYMKDYGTQVVAGTSPGKQGTDVHGIPVYDTVEAAIAAEGPVDFSVIFVPGRVLLPAIEEAADAGVPNLVACVESVPVQDIMVMVEYCRERGTRLLGPGHHRRHHTRGKQWSAGWAEACSGPTPSSPRAPSGSSLVAAASRGPYPGS